MVSPSHGRSWRCAATITHSSRNGCHRCSHLGSPIGANVPTEFTSFQDRKEMYNARLTRTPEDIDALATPFPATSFHSGNSFAGRISVRPLCLRAGPRDRGPDVAHLPQHPADDRSPGPQSVRLISGTPGARNLRRHLRADIQVCRLEWLSQGRHG